MINLNNVERLMNGQVQEIAEMDKQISAIERQKEERTNAHVLERKGTANKVVSQAKELLKVLGCEELLQNNNVNDQELNNVKAELEITRQQKQEIINTNATLKSELLKAEQDKVQIENKYNTLYNQFTNVQAELKAQLEEVTSKLENALKDLAAKTKEVEEVKLQAAKTIEVTKEEVKVVPKVEKEEVVKVEDNTLVKIEAFKNRNEREDVELYSNDKYYVMSSKTCQEITVIPRNIKTEVTDEVVQSIQEQLVSRGYMSQRQVVSPITVLMNKGNIKGYFARVEAKDTLDTFSKEDVYAGYISDASNTYLWTWDGVSELCLTYYLDKVVEGSTNKSVTTATAKMVTKQVKEMYATYLEKVEGQKQEEKAKREADTKAFEEIRKRHEARQNLFAQAMNMQQNMKPEEKQTQASNSKQTDTSNFSAETLAYLDAF